MKAIIPLPCESVDPPKLIPSPPAGWNFENWITLKGNVTAYSCKQHILMNKKI